MLQMVIHHVLKLVLQIMFPPRTKKIILPLHWCDKVQFFNVIEMIHQNSSKLFPDEDILFPDEDVSKDLQRILQANGLTCRRVLTYIKCGISSKMCRIMSTAKFEIPQKNEYCALVEILGQRVVNNNQKHIDEFGKFNFYCVKRFCKLIYAKNLQDSDPLMQWTKANCDMKYSQYYKIYKTILFTKRTNFD
jgi:hypothetical protein